MSAIGGMALSIAGNAANQAISQWINYGFQKKIMGKQYHYEDKLAQNAYNRQLDFWDMQNKYDDPGSQMLRLREAGLNPGMLNGQLGNTSNNLSSVSSGNVGTPPSGPSPGKLDVMQIIRQEEEMKNLAADTEIKREEAEYQRMLNKQEAIRTNDFETYYQLTKDQMVGQKKLNEAQEEYYRNQAKVAFEEARLKGVAANDAEAAQGAGINRVVDAHDVDQANIEQMRTNVNKLTNDMINDNIRLEEELKMQPLLRDFQRALTRETNADAVLKELQKPHAEADAWILENIGVDVSSMPSEIRSVAYMIPLAAQMKKKGITTQEDFDDLVSLCLTTLDQTRANYINSNNPDHVTPKDKLDEEYRNKEYWTNTIKDIVSLINLSLDKKDLVREILLY